jgi:hypothetical protein
MSPADRSASVCREKSKKLACSSQLDGYSVLNIRVFAKTRFKGEGRTFMLSTLAADVDFIEELRLRRWARQHYVPRPQRERAWHPVILDKMQRKDHEMAEAEAVATCA